MTGNIKLIFKAKDWGFCLVALIKVNRTRVGKFWQRALKTLSSENISGNWNQVKKSQENTRALKERKSQKPIFCRSQNNILYEIIQYFWQYIGGKILYSRATMTNSSTCCSLGFYIFFHLCFLSLALLNAAFPSWGRVIRSPTFHYSLWSKNLICMLISL